MQPITGKSSIKFGTKNHATTSSLPVHFSISYHYIKTLITSSGKVQEDIAKLNVQALNL
jgi:hypothetical protein